MVKMVAIPFTQNLWINVHKIRTMKTRNYQTGKIYDDHDFHAQFFKTVMSSISNMHCALQKFKSRDTSSDLEVQISLRPTLTPNDLSLKVKEAA